MPRSSIITFNKIEIIQNIFMPIRIKELENTYQGYTNITLIASDTETGEVGHLVARLKGRDMSISDIYTRPFHRNRGIGTILLRSGVDLADSRGVENLIGGKFLPSAGVESTKEWYEKRGIQIDNSRRLSGRIPDILEALKKI